MQTIVFPCSVVDFVEVIAAKNIPTCTLFMCVGKLMDVNKLCILTDHTIKQAHTQTNKQVV